MLVRNKTKIRYLLKGLLLAIIITTVLLMLISVLLKFTSLSESKLPHLNNITMLISIVISGIYVAFKIKENGWLNGALVGVVYSLIIILLGWIFIKESNSLMFIATRIALSTVTGIIGGMIGINIG